MDLHLNACAEELINQIQNDASNRQLKKTLKSGLSNLNKRDYDTEEKEFICDYFFELAQIVEVDIKDDLNSWLYGSTFNALMKVVNTFKKPEQVLETLCQDCTKCKSKLETFILKREAGIPDYAYQVVRCKECAEFNMIEVGPGVKEFRFGNYDTVEQLRKDEYTEEQAYVRLEQIKYFRK